MTSSLNTSATTTASTTTVTSTTTASTTTVTNTTTTTTITTITTTTTTNTTTTTTTNTFLLAFPLNPCSKSTFSLLSELFEDIQEHGLFVRLGALALLMDSCCPLLSD